MKWKNIVFGAVIIGCLSLIACTTEPNDALSSPPAVALTVELETLAVRIGQPCIIEVSLHNTGTEKLLINKRMATGYADSQSRELFVAIYKKGEDEDIARPTRLYSRDFAPAEDYVWLEPGEQVDARLDLFEWYEVAPGDYELRVFYQADEAWAPVKEGLLQGVHASSSVLLTVLPSGGSAQLQSQHP